MYTTLQWSKNHDLQFGANLARRDENQTNQRFCIMLVKKDGQGLSQG